MLTQKSVYRIETDSNINRVTIVGPGLSPFDFTGENTDGNLKMLEQLVLKLDKVFRAGAKSKLMEVQEVLGII